MLSLHCEQNQDTAVQCSMELPQTLSIKQRDIPAVNDFKKLAEDAHPKSLVVVDFYRTACGSCKYILPGFVKLCKRSGSHAAPVVFLKHNVMDE